MKLGVVDLGTNSLRFSFWQIEAHPESVELLHRKKTMILPGEEVFKTGKVPEKSIKRMVKTLKQFELKAQSLGADGVVAFATCALREAKNSKSVLHEIQTKTSVPLKIISGQREAELIARGVLRSETRIRGRRILIDIGGGSTEVSLVRDRHILESISLPLGAQRLFQLFPELMLGSATELRMDLADKLRAHIRKVLSQKLKKWPRDPVEVALGSSGTIRSLGKLINRRRAAHHSRLAWIRQINTKSKTLPRYKASELTQLNRSLLFLTEKQILSLGGVEPERRPLLTHGALLLEEIMSYFELQQVICTEGSLRDGVIQEVVEGSLRPSPLRPPVKTPLKPKKKKKAKKKAKKKSFSRKKL